MDDPIQRHPTRAEQLDILAAMVAEHSGDGDAVLDLGCGTGYVGQLILGRRPGLRFVGVDLKEDALAAARTNLAAFGTPRLVAADLSRLGEADVPAGPYRAIYSALTFHDLTDASKQAVIAWAAGHLAADGILLVYDRLRLTEPALFGLQQTIWRRLERVYGTGMRAADSWDAYEADLGSANRPAALADYFDWFAQAGLRAQVLHLHGNIALMAAARSG